MRVLDYVNGTLIYVRYSRGLWVGCMSGGRSPIPLEGLLASLKTAHRALVMVFDDFEHIARFKASDHEGLITQTVSNQVARVRGSVCNSLILTVDELREEVRHQGLRVEGGTVNLDFEQMVSAEVGAYGAANPWWTPLFNPLVPRCWWSAFSSEVGMFFYRRQLSVDEAMWHAFRGVRSDLLVHYSGPARISAGMLELPFTEEESLLPALDRSCKAAVTLADQPGEMNAFFVEFSAPNHRQLFEGVEPVMVEFQVPAASSAPYCVCSMGGALRSSVDRVMPLDVSLAVGGGLVAGGGVWDLV